MKGGPFVSLALLTFAAASCGGSQPSSTTGAAGAAGATGSGGSAAGAAGTGGTAGTAAGGSGGGGGGGAAPAPRATLLGLFPQAVSGDGSVVVGRDPQDPARAMRWTSASGATFLAAIDVRAMSVDGTTVVGSVPTPTGAPQAARVAGGAVTPLPFPRATDTQSVALAVCRDGSAVAGHAWAANPYFTSAQAFRWTTAGGTEGLGFLPGDGASEVSAMSPDGETIVGLSYDLQQRKARPFRWTRATGMVELPTLPASSLTLPVAVNDAGTAIGEAFGGGEVSYASISSATSRDPIVWTDGAPHPIAGCGAGQSTVAAIAGGGTVLGTCQQSHLFVAAPGADARLLSLPAPPSGFFESDQSVFPSGISDDATVVVGRRDLGSLGGTANALAVWLDGGPQVSFVAPSLTGDPGGVPLPNPVPLALSEDGSTVVGRADGPAGWVLRLR